MIKTTNNSPKEISRPYSQNIPFRRQFGSEADEGVARLTSDVGLRGERDIKSSNSKSVRLSPEIYYHKTCLNFVNRLIVSQVSRQSEVQ